MHDAQTTGGYPKIGTVIRADLWKLAQARLNLPIRFVRTTPTRARWPRNVRICGRSTWRSTCAKRAAAPSRARRDNGGSGTEGSRRENGPRNQWTRNIMQIDLNADLGEGCGSDEALLDLVTSANIMRVACGRCERDARLRTLGRAERRGDRRAPEHDPENFGRKEMQLPASDIYAGVLYQLGALSAIAQAGRPHRARETARRAVPSRATR